MARTVTFDFATGGVATEGRLTMAGTRIYTTGTTVNLPPTKVTYLEAGLASITGVEPTPVEADGWRYQVKLESTDGSATWWFVSVPAGTDPIGFHLLPVIDAISMPLDATGTQLDTWLTSARAQATAANENALQALEQIETYHGVNGVATPFKTVDSWEQKKIVTYADGSLRAIPYTDMPPGTPATPAAVPGSTSVNVSWTIVSPAERVRLLRNGAVVYDGSSTRFTDRTVAPGATYTYTLVAYDRWGQRSIASGTVTAGPNAALNLPPAVQITTYPNPLPQNGQGLVRVCALDNEAQQLALALSVTVGQLTPTFDPTIWIFTA